MGNEKGGRVFLMRGWNLGEEGFYFRALGLKGESKYLETLEGGGFELAVFELRFCEMRAFGVLGGGGEG